MIELVIATGVLVYAGTGVATMLMGGTASTTTSCPPRIHRRGSTTAFSSSNSGSG